MKKSKMNKKAELLTENLMFILLNLAFFAILAVFIFIKANDPAILEEAYAKKIALALDSARPGMNISLNMDKALSVKDDAYTGKIVSIEGNVVTVKLRQKGGYSYSFFNDISLDKKFFRPSDGDEYKFNVGEYKTEEVVAQ
jgi:hypothetical protein